MRRRHGSGIGLTARVFLVTAGIVLAVVAAATAITVLSLRRSADQGAQRGLEQSADLAAQFLAGRARSLAGGARVFVQNPYFRTLVAQRRRDDVLDQAFEAAEQLDADWVFITDERGTLIAKSDEPSVSGVPLGDVRLVADALRGQTTSGFGESRDSLLFQAVGVPIATPGRAPLGVLVATRVIDARVARDMKATTGSDVVFYRRNPDGARRVTLATIDDAPSLLAMVNGVVTHDGAGHARPPRVTIGGERFLAQGSALTTAGGEAVGGFIVLRGREAELAGIAGVRRSLVVASVLGLLLALASAWLAARLLTRPVHALAALARRAAEGDYAHGTHDVGASAGSPELRKLAQAFDALLSDLRGKDALTAMSPPTGAVQPLAFHADARTDRPAMRPLSSGGGPATRRALRAGFELASGAMLANRYRIESVIGSGGLGIVYRARDQVVDEFVAIKMLRPEVAAVEPGALDRMRNEVRIARRISHRNVVRTHDMGESDGVPFVTMELVEGTSLAAIIDARGALPVPAVLSIATQLMRALAAVLEHGIVHGDLKPANLLVGPNGVVKVSDFGVARFVRSSASPGGGAVGHVGGAVTGTPEYMAPEQLLGAPASPVGDIYAAGMVLQECLSGTSPHHADTPVAFLARKLDPPAPDRRLLDAAHADGELHRLVSAMLEPDPDVRPSSPDALLEQFERLASAH